MIEEQIAKYKNKVDFGIITIKREEFDELIDQFKPSSYVLGQRYYNISKIKAQNNSEYIVAITPCSEQGNGEAQKVAHDLIEDLDPNWILVVGIGGGFPDSEFSLGDVVLCSRLQDFCVSSLDKKNKTTFAITGGPMRVEVQTLLSNLPAFNNKLKEWNYRKNIKMDEPKVEWDKEENFYGNDEYKKTLKSLLQERFGKKAKKRLPKFVVGSVISSDILVKNTGLISTWKKTARQVKAVEMELAGVYRAARKIDKEYPILAIRGISDIVGFKRHEDWTLYACRIAAIFAKTFIKSGIVKKKVLLK